MSSVAVLRSLPTDDLRENRFSLSLYGNPSSETDGLVESIARDGILVPLVVAALVEQTGVWEVISGHRRLACARLLSLSTVPCEIRSFESDDAKQNAVIDYNRHRRKTFSQTMREADAIEATQSARARLRRDANLRQNQETAPDRRNSDNRHNRTDDTIARSIGLGGKDLYRQARAVWNLANSGDIRAVTSVELIDRGEKTIHAAYKDLRRRDRFTAGFRPTPYDVWAFKTDRAFGLPYPGSIPPGIVAHTLHYFSDSDSLIVDPMAGGGTTIDVCAAMGRRYLAYDLNPSRPEIQAHDIRLGFPDATQGCDLIFCDPPYHTMLARQYGSDGLESLPLSDWVAFLTQFARQAFATLRPGGHLALLLANQTEKDLPAGHGYLDHAFFGYQAIVAAGFLPQRRISCPMSGAYRPQDVQRARLDGRMLGQVRDLLIARKPITASDVQSVAGSPAASS